MHPLTLLIVTNVVLGTMALMVLVMWLFNRRVPGLWAWVIAYFCAFFSSLNYAFRPELPPTLGFVSLAVLSTASGYFNLLATRLYVGRPAWPLRWGLLGLAGLGVLVWVLDAMAHSLVLRFSLVSAVAGWLFISAGWIMGRCPLQAHPYRHLFGWTSLLHGLAIWLRPLALFLFSDAPATFTVSFNRGGPFILEGLIAMLLMSFGVLTLVNEHLNAQLRRLAERDPLTDIFNRRSFLSLLDKASSLARRQRQPLAILVIDLDHFKQINDTQGHSVGDQALRHFVQVAQDCLRKEDVLGRLGGEEFAIFLPSASVQDAQEVAERLRRAVASQPLPALPQPIALSVSIGLATCQGNDPPEAAIHRADQAMYLAKQRGRNRVEMAGA